MDPNKKFLVIIGAVIVPVMVAVAFLLTSVFGPSDNGLLCRRSQASAECQVRQTRFFGLVGNTAFSIPESAIRGAQSACATTTVGRAGPSCNVYLVLDSGEKYLVAGYAFRGQAEAGARKLNDYFGDTLAAQVELKEDLQTPMLLYGAVPVLLVAAIIGWRKFRLGSESAR